MTVGWFGIWPRCQRAAFVGLSILLASQLGGCPQTTTSTDTAGEVDQNTSRVRVETSLGSFVIELNRELAPVSVANFLQYAADHHYDGTIFHRSIPGFVVQGGGLRPDLTEKPTGAPIVNESANGLSNGRGSIAMARTEDPDSATSQFYINLADNPVLDATAEGPGYAVFGQVVEGLDVIDQIAAIPTASVGAFDDVPTVTVRILSVSPDTGQDEPPPLDPVTQAYLDQLPTDLLNVGREVLISVLEVLISGR